MGSIVGEDADWNGLATSWTVSAGRLADSVTVESPLSPIDDSVVGSPPKTPLLLRPPSPDRTPCEITISFTQRHEVRQIYVQSTARVYEIYYSPKQQTGNEYLCTVRCDIVDRGEVFVGDCTEPAHVASHGDSMDEFSEERSKSEMNSNASEDDWVEVKVPGTSFEANRNVATSLKSSVKMDFYEATAEITDADPCTSLTIRLLSVQSGDCVYIGEIYVFAEPVESNFEDEDRQLGTTTGTSLMAMLVPSVLQLSKTKNAGQAQDKDASAMRDIQNFPPAGSETAEPDLSSKVTVTANVANRDALVTGIFDTQHMDRVISEPAQETVRETDTDRQQDVSYSRFERVLEQLVSRVSRIESLCLRFEENLIKPINSIEARLQRVEEQLDVINHRVVSSGLRTRKRFSAPECSFSESNITSLYEGNHEESHSNRDSSDTLSVPHDDTCDPVSISQLLPSLSISAPDFPHGPKKEFPKGFHSERDRSRREGSTSLSSWQRFGNVSKEVDESRSMRAGFVDERERKVLRDVKSPTWLKDSGSEQSQRDFRDGKVRQKEKEKSPSVLKGDSGSEQQPKMRLPLKNPEAGKVKAKEKEKSPSWSSERSSSVETKKHEELLAESGSSSEMEEGELEPEVAGKLGLAPEVRNEGSPTKAVQLESGHKQVVESEGRAEVAEEVGKSLCEDGKECPEGSLVEGKREHRVKAFQDHRKISNDEMSGSNGEESETESDSAIVKDREILKGEEESWGGHLESAEEVVHYRVLGKHLPDEEPPKQDEGIDLELKEEGAESLELKLGEPEGSVLTEDKTSLAGGRLVHSFRDMGKSVAFMPIEVAEAAEERVWVEREFRDVVSSRDMDMEGPSTRGFELFSSFPVRKAEKLDNPGIPKQKDGKLGMEQLDLSLSLPNVSLPIGATGDNTTAAPASPSQCRSVQSWSTFCTNSEGFTQSMSFSGSQSFFHNPSCSLSQNSVDYEQSVKSRPLFQGVDWQALAQNDAKPKEVPVYRGSLSNGNGSLFQSQAVQGNSNGEFGQGLNLKVSEGRSKMLSGLDRQLSFNKQFLGEQAKHNDDVKFPSQGVGSDDLGTSYGFDKKQAAREKHGGSLYRSGSQKERDQLLMGGSGTEFVESLIEKIVSEPLYEIARKFREMREESLACFKESIRELMANKDKQRQLLAFRDALRNRSDITIEMLLKCHQAQLEILVALKTGLPDYLQLQSGLPSAELAEIFLNLRCRNLSCRNALPVDECDCKVCVKKDGFCSDCMCLVCSKFDMASNTCSWVGCDVCLHWCHVDCAIRKSYIRNGHSATGTHGRTGMQFHCVACNHPSEMFGFVKEVFQNFASGWNIENFYRELEYVKRIFRASKDLRGRRLNEVADQMLAILGNKANLSEVYSYIMSFLNESDPAKCDKTLASGIERGKGVNNVAGTSQDMSWVTAMVAEKVPFQGEPVSSTIPSPNMGRSDKHALELELQRNDKKEPLFDELESIVRIKQVEAKMFQNRADDARREAEGLKRIAMAKNEKFDEEYMARIAKLRLPEAEELRRQKFEELQASERAHREYFNMKIRMEADIKDLLLKMEATERNLSL